MQQAGPCGPHGKTALGFEETYGAVGVEAADAGANDPAASSCGVAANHVDSAGAGKVDGARALGEVAHEVGCGPAQHMTHRKISSATPQDTQAIGRITTISLANYMLLIGTGW